MDCLFCKIIANEIPAYKVYEDDNFLAFLDINPVNLGHTLVVSKIHHRNLLDMPEDLTTKLGPLLKQLAQATKGAVKADGFNIIWNNEPVAGQLIYHSHVHIIPRFTGDNFEHWHGKTKPTVEELIENAKKIREYL